MSWSWNASPIHNLPTVGLRQHDVEPVTVPPMTIRVFDSGATRDIDNNKFDYEGFLSPLVVERFGAYMHKHRLQPNGELRASDNWQKGIPLDVYIKSGFRHFVDWWLTHRGHKSKEDSEEALCGLLFNVQGYLHELLKEKGK